MRITCVQIFSEDAEKIEKLVGTLYPSRSELFRVAVHNWILQKLRTEEMKQRNIVEEIKEPEIFDDENFVKVPIESIIENSEPVRAFKTYKIVKRLE